jgi:flagellar hook-length control protein FliK
MMGIMPVGDVVSIALPVAQERDEDASLVVPESHDTGNNAKRHKESQSVDFVQQLLQQVQVAMDSAQRPLRQVQLAFTGDAIPEEFLSLGDMIKDAASDLDDDTGNKLLGLGVHVPTVEGSDLSLKLKQVSVVASEQIVPNITERKPLASSLSQVPVNSVYKSAEILSKQYFTDHEPSFSTSDEDEISGELKAVASFANDSLKSVTKEGVTSVAKDSLMTTRQSGFLQREAVVVVNDKRTSESGIPAEFGLTENSFEESLLDVKEPTVNGVRQALSESGNGEIVRRAQIVLNGKDTGEIRLILRPEHLGTVRIHLNMEEGRVLGRILVNDTMVKAAFDDNMGDLRDSFLKQGLKGELDVSVGGDNHSGGASADQQGWIKGSGFVSQRVRSSQADEELGVVGALGASDLYLQA